MDRFTTKRLASQRPDTGEPELCVEHPDDQPLDERVARFVDTIQRGLERRADSPMLATPVTPDTLLDDRDILARRLRWYGAGATLVAVACLSLLVVQGLTPPAEHTHAAQRVTVEASYTIDEVARIGEMTIVVSHLVSFAQSARLHLLAVNPSENAQPGGVALSDGEGNEIEVIPKDDKVRARTVEHRSVEVGEEFNPRSRKMRVIDKKSSRAVP